MIGPEFVLTLGWSHRIAGLRREIAVKYCILRDGNRCAIKSSCCIMGDRPFENPLRANLDHILPVVLGGGDNVGNVRLACGPCNTHHFKTQYFDWKTNRTPKLVRNESERESIPHAEAWASREGEQGERQSAYWDLWIKRSDGESPWNRLGRKQGDYVRLSDLLDRAPRDIGRLYANVEKFGSSVTYRRYAMEDRFSLLELTKEKGEWLVRFRIEGAAK